MLARSIVALRKGEIKLGRMYAWLFRTLLCLIAVWYPSRPGFDMEDLVVGVLAAAAFALGWWQVMRIKKVEDLTREIFPDEEP
jgi:hypothetical protein